MPVVVQKYGGSSVADVEKMRKVAEKVAAARRSGKDVCVVVSAMGDTTDELLALAKQVSAAPPRRELDMLLTRRASGSRWRSSRWRYRSRASTPISFTGSQSGIITTDAHAAARIVEVRPFRVQEELARGRVVIVAGFQGVSPRKEVTTLGRGGSDTTAVALAAALGGDCEIYSDVAGVFTADPRVVPVGAAARRALLRRDAGARAGRREGAERPGRRVREGAGHRDPRALDLRRRRGDGRARRRAPGADRRRRHAEGARAPGAPRRRALPAVLERLEATRRGRGRDREPGRDGGARARARQRARLASPPRALRADAPGHRDRRRGDRRGLGGRDRALRRPPRAARGDGRRSPASARPPARSSRPRSA